MKNNMQYVKPGHVWENGKCLVKIQKDLDRLHLITFDMDNSGLRFSSDLRASPGEALKYMESLGCRPTAKVLVAKDK